MEERKGWSMENWKVVFSSRFLKLSKKKSSKSQFNVMRRKSTKINCDFYNAQRAIAIKKTTRLYWKLHRKSTKKKLQLRPRNDFAQKIRHVIIGNWESIKQRDYHELNASNEFAVITMKSHTYNIFNRWCETKSSE